MELFTTLSLLFIIPIIFTFFFKKWTTKSKLPPGPKPWPIIGNIHQLGNKPHRSVNELSKIYGPIMTLKLGSVTTIVISSSKVAQDLFLTHDLAISSRAVPQAGKSGNHHKFSMIWLPVCPKWRLLRKIATIQLFTTQRLNTSQVLRENKVKELVEYVHECCKTSVPVDIGKVAFTTSLNLLSNTFFSKNLDSYTSLYSQEFKNLVGKISEEGGKPNISDFFSIMKHIDLQGVLKRSNIYFKKIFGILEEIIDARLKDNSMIVKDDVLSTLLKLVQDGELSLDDVKHLLFDMFLAGTDTTSSTLEWAMTELICNPEKIIKAQYEIDKVFVKEGFIQEPEICRLPYLEAIIKETLRLHPPVPILLHKAEKNIELGGYSVLKGTQIWVNAWSIGRDSNVWPNPLLFMPERFLDKKIDIKGQNFQLIPFGAGRRMCPGIPLAYRMVHLMLAALLHSFNWKYGDESVTHVDMEEDFGLTMKKTQPLLVIPLPR